MTKLLTVMLIACGFAGLAQWRDRRLSDDGSGRRDVFFTLLVVILMTVFCGLRTAYNDTFAYVWIFEHYTPDINNVFASIDWSIGANPGFKIINALLKTLGFNRYSYIMFYTVLTIPTYVWIIRKYSRHFAFSLFIFVASGYYVFCFAAIKQCLAVAIIMWGIPALLKKKWIPFVLLVLFATTIHPYSLLYLTAIFFTAKPWKKQTYITLVACFGGAFLFERLITVVADLTTELGESFSVEELTGAGTHPLRVLVYAIPVVLALLYRKELFEDSESSDNLFTNLSILCFGIIVIALFGTANYFARLANYFLISMSISLPWLLLKIKDRLKPFYVYCLVIVFTGFLYYSSAVMIPFDSEYRSITIWQFFGYLFG